jgi:biopolymer transport protein ExbD/biopolymer transport protein TolR
MAMQAGNNKGGTLSDMNVVPLIDILLVLLIIFMVITPTIPMGLQALVPQPNNQKVDSLPPDGIVVVQVLAGDKVKINEEDSSWDKLGARLNEIFKLRAEKVAFVKGEADTDFGEVARAIDIMRSAGIDKVGLLPGAGGKA